MIVLPLDFDSLMLMNIDDDLNHHLNQLNYLIEYSNVMMAVVLE